MSDNERKILLALARQAITDTANGMSLTPINLDELPERLRQPGASFVTLTRHDQLRGCIGGLQPTLPLAEDVREHAVAAATKDFRFPTVQPHELEQIEIEISRLTLPQDLNYEQPEMLQTLIRPGIDGVILRDGFRRATFLPQVWDKIPDPAVFLDHLCQKMGVRPDLWRQKKLDVQVYQVEEFHE